MKSEIISTKGLKRELKVIVPASVVKETSDKLYQNLKNKVSIKGFRKGKYPKSLLEKRFSENIQQEMKQEIVPEYLTQALQEHKLRAVTQPKIDAKEVLKNQSFEFMASFEIFPEFPIPDFKKKIQLKTANIKIPPQEIKNYANLISLQNTQYEEKIRKVKDKDQVNIQLHFQKIGKNKEDKKVHIFYYVGSNEISEELDKALIGMKKEEKKELKLKVSPHTLSRDIAGKEIQLEVMLLAVAEPLSVVKDEKFYQKINPALKNAAELMKFSENSLKIAREKDLVIQEQEFIRSQLLNLMDFAVPEESLQDKIEAIEQQKAQNNKTADSPNDETDPDKTEPDKIEPNKTEPNKTEPDKTEPDKTEPDKTEPDKIEPDKTEPNKTEPDKKKPAEPNKTEPDKIEPNKTEPNKTEPEKSQKTKQEALDSLRYQFLMAKIIEEKKIQVSNEEMDEGIRQMAKSYGITSAQLMQDEYGKKLSNILRNQLEENKVLDFIRKEATRV